MKKYLFIPILLLTCLLSGCWDRLEIEEIGFVIGVAFDPVEEEEGKEDELGRKALEGKKSAHEHMFTSTYQVAIPALLTLGEGGGGGDQKPFFNISSEGMTNFKAKRSIDTRRSRHIRFVHLKVIIINQELARMGLLEHLTDFYIRDHEMRRRTQVFISDGEAKSLFEDKLPLEDMPALSINRMAENYTRALEMIEMSMIGDVAERVVGKRSYLIPRIVKLGKEDVQIVGAAIFLGTTNKMLGWLGEEDIAGYNWIVGNVGTGVLEVEYEGEHPFIFETTSMAAKTKYERKNDQNNFHIEIRAEGTFGESWLHGVEINDEETLKKLEKAVEEKIVKDATSTIKKIQEEFQADVFEFGQLIKQKEYNYWEKSILKWDGEGGDFSKAKITVDAKVEIRHYMINERLE